MQWCERNCLKLHIRNTREMIMDFRRKIGQPGPVVIRGKAIERVVTYEYLGVHFDCKLSWKRDTDAVLKKGHTRLFCLRKLRSFQARHELLQMFYSSCLSSVLTFCLSSWGGNISKQDKGAMDKIITKASAVVVRGQR